MFFKRRGGENESVTGQAGPLSDWNTAEDQKIEQGEYWIVPCVKQLTNGKWVVRLAFESQREDGAHRYDFPGPMREYDDRITACKAGLQFAVKRIQAMSEIRSVPEDFE